MAETHTLRSFEELIYDDISRRCCADSVDVEPAAYKELSVYVCGRPFQWGYHHWWSVRKKTERKRRNNNSEDCLMAEGTLLLSSELWPLEIFVVTQIAHVLPNTCSYASSQKNISTDLESFFCPPDEKNSINRLFCSALVTRSLLCEGIWALQMQNAPLCWSACCCCHCWVNIDSLWKLKKSHTFRW